MPWSVKRVAQTESSREVEVVARVSGFLERIVYTEGALVEEGDVMFQMDRRPFEARLEAARGELEASRARLATAQANLDRTQPLAEAVRFGCAAGALAATSNPTDLAVLGRAQSRDEAVERACEACVALSRGAAFLALRKGAFRGWAGAGEEVTAAAIRSRPFASTAGL